MAFKQSGQILSQAKGTLHRLLVRTDDLILLQRLVRKVVAGDIFVASLDQGQLHLITPSAALATRLKYSQKTVIASLIQRKNPYPVDSMKISVRPDYIPPAKPERHTTPVSQANAEHIAETAQYIEDEALRKALFRLSNHVKPSS
jgi:hypothetical protein